MNVILEARLDVLDVGVIEVLDEPFRTAPLLQGHHLVAPEFRCVLPVHATHPLEDEIGVRKVLHIVKREALRLVVGIHKGYDALEVAAPRCSDIR